MTIVLSPTQVGAAGRDFTSYDGYIEDQGLIFQIEADQLTQSLPLQPGKQDTGNNPSEVRPEYGQFFAQEDFSHGMGQEKYHSQQRNERKYLWSRGVDISKPGRLRHAHAFTSVRNGVHGPVKASSSGLFILTGPVGAYDTLLRTTDLVAFPSEDPFPSGTGVITDVIAGSDKVFVGLGVTGGDGYVRQRDAMGNWSTIFTSAGAVPGKLCYAHGGHVIFAWGASALKDTVPGSTTLDLDTFPSGSSILDIWTAGRFIYVAVDEGPRSSIYHYALKSDASAWEPKGSTELPLGFTPGCGLGYVGRVYIGGSLQESETSVRPVLYEAESDADGFLAYQEVTEGFNGSTDRCRVVDMIPVGNTILLNWTTGPDDLLTGAQDGVAVYDISRAAFSLLGRVASSAADYSSDSAKSYLERFNGRTIYATPSKLWAEDPAKFELDATLITSIADWLNAGVKSWDLVDVIHSALPLGASVDLYYTTEHPEKNQWTLIGTSDIQGETGASFTVNVTSRYFALKIVSHAGPGQTTAPEIVGYSVRSNSSARTKQAVLQRTFRIFETDKKNAGVAGEGEETYARTNPVGGNPDPDYERSWLEAKAYDWVNYYEQDTHWYARIEQISSRRISGARYKGTQGEPSENGWEVALIMVGTKQEA